MDHTAAAQRKKRIDTAIAYARATAAAAFKDLKNPNKGKMGATTAEDDIIVTNQFIDRLAVGLQVAVDTDASPFTVLEDLTWEVFMEDFPQEITAVEKIVLKLPDIKEKLPDKQAIHDQMKACFSTARDALKRGLTEARGNSPIPDTDYGRSA